MKGAMTKLENYVHNLRNQNWGGKRDNAGRPKEEGSRRDNTDRRQYWHKDVASELPNYVWLGRHGWWTNKLTSEDQPWQHASEAAIRKHVFDELTKLKKNWMPKAWPTPYDVTETYKRYQTLATPEGLKHVPVDEVMPGPWNLTTGQKMRGQYWANGMKTELLPDGGFISKRAEDTIFGTRFVPWPHHIIQDETPHWDKFLRDVLPNKTTADYLKALIGFTIANDTSHHMLPVIHGPAGTGKTTLMKIVSGLVGHHCTIEINSAAELGGRFAGEILSHNSLIIIEELDRSARNPGDKERQGRAVIKAVTGGSAPSAEKKFRSGRTRITRPPAIWICGNYLPLWIQGTEDVAAWERRMKPIPMVCPIPKEEQQYDLAEMILAEEGTDIASNCYQEWDNWRHRTRKPDQSVDLLEQLVTQSMPLAARWARTHLRPMMHSPTTTDAIHSSAQDWYKEQGVDYDTTREGRAVLAQVRKVGGKPYRTRTERGYTGVELKP